MGWMSRTKSTGSCIAAGAAAAARRAAPERRMRHFARFVTYTFKKIIHQEDLAGDRFAGGTLPRQGASGSSFAPPVPLHHHGTQRGAPGVPTSSFSTLGRGTPPHGCPKNGNAPLVMYTFRLSCAETPKATAVG